MVSVAQTLLEIAMATREKPAVIKGESRLLTMLN